MILDGHIHIYDGSDDRGQFIKNMRAAGVNGGIIISLPPSSFATIAEPRPFQERLDNLFYWCEAGPDLYPFLWVDPLEPDVEMQISTGIDQGVAGFKVICDRYYPGDGRAVKAFRHIAACKKPILFHSGILWDAKPSSMYNRPVSFESLLDVETLRFALAHMAWPWNDECVAVLGKAINMKAKKKELSGELFVDTTRGTPEIYREDVLSKFFKVGYDVEKNIFFGTDYSVNNYQTRAPIDKDIQILRNAGVKEDVIDAYFSRNLKRFLGAMK